MASRDISEGEYYHVYNRGVNKQDIFYDERDWVRFLISILFSQSPLDVNNPGYLVTKFIGHPMLDNSKLLGRVVKDRYVELVGFCLMPNHFHLIVKEHKEGGIAKYMQRVQNAYTKYFNTKHQKSGHLFQGPYKIVHVEDNEQLLYLSAYIHRNPLDLPKSVISKIIGHPMLDKMKKEEIYPWSSYQDYLGENRFEGLLVPEVITEQFEEGGVSGEKAATAYREAVENSGAKEHDPDFDASLLIDVEQ